MSRGEAAVPPFSLHAWVDESITSTSVHGPGAYVMAAVVADAAQCDALRDKLRDLASSRRGRLHWWHERPTRRDQIAQAVAAADLAAIVTVGTPVRGALQERARSQCLERLLIELQRLDVSQAWLESRTQSLNRRDLHVIAAMFGHHLLTRNFRVSFRRPLDEPMLWLPDAVAGAVTSARRGEPRWLQMLGPMVTVVDVDLR